MGALRDRMAQDLVLRGLRPGTCEQYLRCVKALAAFFHLSPDVLTADQVRAFFLHLREERKLARATYVVYLAAIVFFYRETLRRPEMVDGIPRPRAKRLAPPVVLTVSEVQRLLAGAPSPFARTLMLVAYDCGLRISEVCRLRVEDVRSKDGFLHIRDAKGGKDRVVRLSDTTLQVLRQHWRYEKLTGAWLFPARPAGSPMHAQLWADHPVNKRTVGEWFRTAANAASLPKAVHFHTLRHSYATVLLEAGVPLNAIQISLGHTDLETTTRYAQVRPELIRNMPSPLTAEVRA
jgi:integrase/recombinase XerD